MDELAIIEWMQGASPALDGFMMLVSGLVTYAAIWFVLAFLFTCHPKHRELGIAVVLAVVISFIIADLILKPAVCRVRPYNVVDIEPIVDSISSYSFPSAHTTYSFAAATAIFLYNKKWGALALVFSVLVGVSRVYLYMHWPTDILAGAVVGALSALVAVWLVRRFYVGDLESEG